MQKEKGIIAIIIIAVVVAAVLGIGGYFVYKNYSQPKLIGGDKDAHGCLIAAGYSWCDVKNKCLRTWEEKCEVAVDSTAASANNLLQIGRNIIAGWLDESKLANLPDNKRIVDYRINSVIVGDFNQEKQCFFLSVDFSVQAPISPEQGNRVQSDWTAGNGVVGANNWINNKNLVFSVVKRDNNTYEIVNGGTGGTGNDCSISSQYSTHFIYKVK